MWDAIWDIHRSQRNVRNVGHPPFRIWGGGYGNALIEHRQAGDIIVREPA